MSTGEKTSKEGEILNRIKIFRQQNAMTVKKLSEISGVAAGYISDLENDNKSNPSRETMQKIAEALGKTVTEVFFPEEMDKEVS